MALPRAGGRNDSINFAGGSLFVFDGRQSSSAKCMRPLRLLSARSPRPANQLVGVEFEVAATNQTFQFGPSRCRRIDVANHNCLSVDSLDWSAMTGSTGLYTSALSPAGRSARSHLVLKLISFPFICKPPGPPGHCGEPAHCCYANARPESNLDTPACQAARVSRPAGRPEQMEFGHSWRCAARTRPEPHSRAREPVQATANRPSQSAGQTHTHRVHLACPKTRTCLHATRNNAKRRQHLTGLAASRMCRPVAAFRALPFLLVGLPPPSNIPWRPFRCPLSLASSI